ncbi:MAG: hypothetical protein R3E96_09660 [Planctomycetota bacterium]
MASATAPTGTLATLKQQRIDLETRRAALPAAHYPRRPRTQAEGLRTLVHDLHKRRESAEVALAGLMPGARVLEPAGEPTPRGPFLWLLGILIGFGIGGVLALGLAEMRSRRKPGAPARRRRGERGPDEVQLPILARLGKDTLPEPLSWDMRGTAFAGLRRLRVQLGLMDRRSWNTSLLGIAGDAAASEGRESAAVTYGLALTHRLANRSVLIIDACGDGRGLTQDSSSPANRSCSASKAKPLETEPRDRGHLPGRSAAERHRPRP